MQTLLLNMQMSLSTERNCLCELNNALLACLICLVVCEGEQRAQTVPICALAANLTTLSSGESCPRLQAEGRPFLAQMQAGGPSPPSAGFLPPPPVKSSSFSRSAADQTPIPPAFSSYLEWSRLLARSESVLLAD